MTWSYSGDPSASDLDAVRFTIGDTDTNSQQLSDEEISYLLSQSGGSADAASIAACRSMIARYSRYVDQKTGDIDIKYSQLIGHFESVIMHIRQGMDPIVYAGGISVSDMETVESDTDRQASIFSIAHLDNPPYRTPDDDPYGPGSAA